jgi:hypothetical protein
LTTSFLPPTTTTALKITGSEQGKEFQADLFAGWGGLGEEVEQFGIVVVKELEEIYAK